LASGAIHSRHSWLSIAVFSYALLVAVNTLVLSPAYSPAGLYHPLLLAIAFAVGRRFSERGEREAALASLGAVAILAIWGLAQLAAPAHPRAQAIFETPATYAAVINLALVPVLTLLLFSARVGTKLGTIGILLAAALFAADSRGGQLALAAGMGFAVILAQRAGMFQPRRVAVIVMLVVLGWMAAASLRALPTPDPAAAPTVEARAESSLSRLELYALSWNAWLERPLIGSGYLTFRYALEQGRAQVPSYGASDETWFAHNDYLQTLQELGPLGLVALLTLVVFPPLFADRKIQALSSQRQTAVAAAASGMAAMSVHALVDYPFYVPACLLLYGALLGVLDRRLGEARTLSAPRWQAAPWLRAVRTGMLLLDGLFLLRPVAA
jgi:O-antigen ligase